MMNVAFQWSKKMQPKGFLKNIVICNIEHTLGIDKNVVFFPTTVSKRAI